MRPLVWRTSTVAALVVCVAAAYSAAVTLAAARDVSVILPFGERASVQLHPLVSDSDSSDIWEAIEADPFRPDRTSATARYRLPGTVPDSEHLAEQHAPAVTLLGTVMSTDGSGFALCQTGDEPARLIRPGQSIGGLKLQRVEQAKALFKGADGRSVTLTVPQGGPP